MRKIKRYKEELNWEYVMEKMGNIDSLKLSSYPDFQLKIDKNALLPDLRSYAVALLRYCNWVEDSPLEESTGDSNLSVGRARK